MKSISCKEFGRNCWISARTPGFSTDCVTNLSCFGSVFHIKFTSSCKTWGHIVAGFFRFLLQPLLRSEMNVFYFELFFFFDHKLQLHLLLWYGGVEFPNLFLPVEVFNIKSHPSRSHESPMGCLFFSFFFFPASSATNSAQLIMGFDSQDHETITKLLPYVRP